MWPLYVRFTIASLRLPVAALLLFSSREIAASVRCYDMQDRSTNFDQGLHLKTIQQAREGNRLLAQVYTNGLAPRLNPKLARPSCVGVPG